MAPKPKRSWRWRKKSRLRSRPPTGRRRKSLSSKGHETVSQPVWRDMIFARDLFPAFAVELEKRVSLKIRMNFRQFNPVGNRQGELVDFRSPNYYDIAALYFCDFNRRFKRICSYCAASMNRRIRIPRHHEIQAIRQGFFRQR